MREKIIQKTDTGKGLYSEKIIEASLPTTEAQDSIDAVLRKRIMYWDKWKPWGKQ